MTGAAFRVPDHDGRLRPADHRGNVCDFTFTLENGTVKGCGKKGAHYCEPRADKVVAFFKEQLTYPSGPYALQPFVLEPWQEHDIIRPLFGEVRWTEWGRYGRRYSLATICLSRKNGKTGLLSGIALYLLVADGEYAAQVYTAAIDTEQAKLVFEPAVNMRNASHDLAGLLVHNKQTKRLIFPDKASYFAVIPADAEGALGFNPHGTVIDEILNQPNSKLYDALRTGMGARVQALLILATTETSENVSFGAASIDQAERLQGTPEAAWHHFVYVRKMPRNAKELTRLKRLFPKHRDLPVSLDITDERNWKWPNPALDGFLKRQVLRDELDDAHGSNTAMSSFLQYRMNQRVQTTSRHIDIDLWDANIGKHGELDQDSVRELMIGSAAWAGLDLSSKLDLTAWVLLFPEGEIIPRFWIPEARVASLTEDTGGKFAEWVAAGLITATDGDTIDYDQIYSDVAEDARDFAIHRVVYDRWSGEPVRQKITQLTGLEMVESDTTYTRMTGPMNELTRMLTAKELQHFGHPVMRWMAENLEAKRPNDDPDRIRPVKPAKDAGGKHIDGIMGLLFGIDSKISTVGVATQSAYEESDLRVV